MGVLAFLVWLVGFMYFILYCVKRLLPRVLSLFFKRKLGIEVHVGQVQVLSWSIKNLRLISNGFTVEVEQVKLSSSFFNREVSRPITLSLVDVRLERDLQQKKTNNASGGKSYYGIYHGGRMPEADTARKSFDRSQVPQWAINCIQFLGLHVQSGQILLLNVPRKDSLISLTFEKIGLSGIITSPQEGSINGHVDALHTRIYSRAVPQPSSIQSSSSQLSFGVKLEVKFGIQHGLSILNLRCCLLGSTIQIGEDWLRVPPTSSMNTDLGDVTQPDSVSTSAFFATPLIQSLLPSNVDVRLDSLSLCADPGREQESIRLTVTELLITSHVDEWSSILGADDSIDQLPSSTYVTISVEQVVVSSCSRPLLLVSEVHSRIETLPRGEVSSAFSVKAFSVLYNSSDMECWLSRLLARKHESVSKKRLVSRFSEFIVAKAEKISFCAEAGHISAALVSPSGKSYLGVGTNQLQFSATGVPERGLKDSAKLPLRKWKGELSANNLWSSLLDSSSPSAPGLGVALRSGVVLSSTSFPVRSGKSSEGNLNHKVHTWNNPISLGPVVFQFEVWDQIRATLMVEAVRFEWSDRLCVTLLEVQQAFEGIAPGWNRNTSQQMQLAEKKKKALKLELKMSSINAFFLHKNDYCIMVRIDALSVSRNNRRLKLRVEEFRLVHLTLHGHVTFYCQSSNDMSDPFWSFPEMNCTFERPTSSLHCVVQGDVSVKWKSSFHLAIIHIVESFQKLKSQILSSDLFDKSDSASRPNVSQPFSFMMLITGETNFEAAISENGRAAFIAMELRFSCNREPSSGLFFVASTHDAKIVSENAAIFTAKDFNVRLMPKDPELTADRSTWEELSASENRVLRFTFGSLCFQLPYGFSFAKAFTEETLGVVKWLKRVVHKKDTSPFKEGQRLPPDLSIRIRSFILELPDDPFEVSLRDNTLLMMDEANEREKRNKALQDRIDSLPEGKLRELLAALPERNAQLYIERSRKQREIDPPRTHLIVWEMTNLEWTAFADPNFHGEENVIEQLQSMDDESPWPTEIPRFSTLWCRCVKWDCSSMILRLRDYPQKLWVMKEFHLWGRLAGAEAAPSWRAKRNYTVYVEAPWEPVTMERSMMPLKFYYDLSCDVDSWSVAYGPCWEPALSQVSLAWEKVSRPSLDPSPPLPYWDKIRLLCHGRLTLSCNTLTLLLHASLDPYNTTEEMALRWSELVLDWTNAKLMFRGGLDILVRTASKYDDCRLLHLPQVRLAIKLDWHSIGDSNDHHGISPCSPSRLPEYSSNQQHDSYRAFRSQSVSLSLSLETKPASERQDLSVPCALFYASTFRWFENLKLILSGVSRPTRRGSLFGNIRPRKPPLSRHYKNIRLSLSFHQFSLCYWMSSARQKGFELRTGRVSLSSEHILSLIPVVDGLKHRPKAEWSITYLNCAVGSTEVWLLSSLQPRTSALEFSAAMDTASSFGSTMSLNSNLPNLPACEKWFFFSLSGVTYSREASAVPPQQESPTVHHTVSGSKGPAHRLVIHDLRGAWTKSTKDVAMALYDGFIKAQTLRKNLSRDALRPFFRDVPSSQQVPTSSTKTVPGKEVAAKSSIKEESVDGSAATASSVRLTPMSPSPHSKAQTNQAASMLQNLLADAENPFVYTEDADPEHHQQERLEGLSRCVMDEDHTENWLVELVNPQVLLKGVETGGYIIGCASKATIHQRLHGPVWKEGTLVSKSTWVGGLEGMQYYATVNMGVDPMGQKCNESIRWLTKENIEDAHPSVVIADLPDMPELVGSGQSVGGVVSTMVGASGFVEDGVQLQRIISRCRCQFYFASFGNTSLDPAELVHSPPPIPEGFDIWGANREPHDAFTLVHHDLEVSTNALQYAMVLDIFNNLLLYMEPTRKEAAERIQRLRFEAQLSSVEDQRKPILELQNEVRRLIRDLRVLDREAYSLAKDLADKASPSTKKDFERATKLAKDTHKIKEDLYSLSEELNIKLSIYKESQLKKAASNSGSTWVKNEQVEFDRLMKPTRTAEICFTQAQWRLTEADGQIGIADLVLKNFLYKRVTMENDAVEHLAELGYIYMKNLMPKKFYGDVLKPTDIPSSLPLDRQRALRVFCRDKPPVGGISIKDHFEINLCPVRIALEKQFVDKILHFMFPEDETLDSGEEREEHQETKKKKKKDGKDRKAGRKDSNFYVRMDNDPVEKMKERAEQNKLFVYIKVPEVQVRLSYKGLKEKNLRDVHDFFLTVPTLEYHNVTWSWLDFYRSIRSDARGELISQLLKQKFFGSSILTPKAGEGSSTKDDVDKEDQARRLLLGILPETKNKKHHGPRNYNHHSNQ